MGDQEEKKDLKTPAYIRRSVAAYRQRNQQVNIYVSQDVRERMRAADITPKKIVALIVQELERLGM